MRHFFVCVAFFMGPITPVTAEVVAVCGDPAAQHSERVGRAPSLQVSRMLQSDPAPTAPGQHIALWRDKAGFDVLLNWGEPDQRSLRAEGAQILGDEISTDLVHLMVAPREIFGLEHFLFRFEGSLPGELVWSGAKSVSPEAADALTFQYVCMKSN